MLKVIIADDESKVCQLIEKLIDWPSFDMEIIGVASNGVEALEQIQRLDPDLVITDIRMPGYDGIEMIRRAKEIKPEVEFIIISGYRHFEYAQSAIRYGVSDYLLKPIKKTELENTLRKMTQRYKEKMSQVTQEEAMKSRLKSAESRMRAGLFTDILISETSKIERMDLEQINHEYNYTFSEGLFRIIIIKPDIGYDDAYDNSMQFLEDKIQELIVKNLKPDCIDMEVFVYSNNAYCVLNYTEDNKERLRKAYKSLLDEIILQSNIFEGLEVSIGIGIVVRGARNLRDSCISAISAVGMRFYTTTGRLMEGITAHKTPSEASLVPTEENKRIEQATEVLDLPRAHAIIARVKNAAKKMSIEDGVEILPVVVNLFNLFLYQLRSNQFPVENERELSVDFSIHANRCSSIDMLFEYLDKKVDDVFTKIILEKKQADTRPIRLAKQYIQDNYMNQLTLADVSAQVGFNMSYFSTLFKSETNQNFVEYLSEVRMEKAKVLLKETTLGIAAVCEAVGYSDLKYFTKSFIKYTGIKPTEYRKLYS